MVSVLYLRRWYAWVCNPAPGDSAGPVSRAFPFAILPGRDDTTTGDLAASKVTISCHERLDNCR